MCTELREQPALSVARVEVNYFQRRLPGASIKAAPFPILFLFHSVSPLISIRLPFSMFLPHDTHTHIQNWRMRTCTAPRRSWLSSLLFLIPSQSPSPPYRAALVDERALHECTRLPWLRRESARIARFLRESGNSRVSDETMCHGSLISHGKVRPGERYARESSRARNFAFGLTIMRHVSGKFINAPAGTTRNYEWTVENNRPRRTKRSMRTVDPGFP